MAYFDLPYGKKFLKFEIADERLLGVLQPEAFPAPKPLSELLSEALAQPISAKPFREIFKRGERVTVVVPDKTRHCAATDILPVLMAELNSLGISDSAIKIVIASGSHLSQTDAEMAQIVGREIQSRINVIEHASRNPDDLIFMGETRFGTPVYLNRHVVTADRIIVLSAAVHHYFAGYGGGWKMLNPGCAGYETIRRNHALTIDENGGIHRQCRAGILERNPVQEDLLDSMRFIRADFLVETVLNQAGEVIAVFAGDLFAAHRRACALVDELYRVTIDRKADMVVASCGGFPKDINFIQAHKSLENAFQAVREGGMIVLVAECRDGIGSETFLDWFRFKETDRLRRALRENFTLNATTALSLKMKVQKCKVMLVSRLPSDQVALLGMNAANDLAAGWTSATSGLPNDFRYYLIPNASLTLPTLN